MITKIVIVYQIDPLGDKIGGIETFIKSFIKYSPGNFKIFFFGISSNCQSRPPGRWIKARFGSVEFDFLPLFFEKDENRKKAIPLSLRFTFMLLWYMLKHRLPEGVLFFNGIEPALLFKIKRASKVLIIHNDIEKMVLGESAWSKFPHLYFIYANPILKSIDRIYVVNVKALNFFSNRYLNIRNRLSFLPTMLDNSIYYATDEKKTKLKNFP